MVVNYETTPFVEIRLTQPAQFGNMSDLLVYSHTLPVHFILLFGDEIKHRATLVS